MISVDSAEEKRDHFTWFTIFDVSFHIYLYIYISDVTLEKYDKATGRGGDGNGGISETCPSKAMAQELKEKLAERRSRAEEAQD